MFVSPQFLVLARAVDDLAGGYLLEVLPVDRLAVGLCGLLQPGGRDPAVLPGDLLGHGHGQVLGVLHGADELRGLVEALHGAGVQPRVAAAQGHDGQRPLLQVHPVEVGDLELAACGGPHLMRLGGDVARVEVQAGDGVGALGALGLLLDGDGTALTVELHDAEALGVVHVVAEDRGPTGLGVLDGARQVARQAVAVEDVIAEHERARLAGDEVLADGECLRQAVRAGLLGVGEVYAVARAVPEQALEVGEVGRRGDDQDVPDARQHEGGQRVVDHGLVVDRQKLLGGHERERVQARAGTAGEDYAFHELASFRMTLVVLMALMLFDRQLLSKLAKLRIELRKTNAQPKANNKQDEDEEQEHEVRRRHGANEIRKPEKHLRKNTGKQQQGRKAKPEQRVLKTHLGIANFHGHITKREQGRRKQRNAKRKRHAASPSKLLRKNWINRIDKVMRSIYLTDDFQLK